MRRRSIRSGKTYGVLPGVVSLASCVLMLALYGLALSHEALHLCPHTHGHGHVVHGCAEHPESEHSHEGSEDTHCGLCELIYSASLGIEAFPLVAVEVPTATFPPFHSVFRAYLMPRPPGRAPPA